MWRLLALRSFPWAGGLVRRKEKSLVAAFASAATRPGVNCGGRNQVLCRTPLPHHVPSASLSSHQPPHVQMASTTTEKKLDSPCCPGGSWPALKSTYQGVGKIVDIASDESKSSTLSAYVVGSEQAKGALVCFPDIFGLDSGRTKAICDQVSQPRTVWHKLRSIFAIVLCVISRVPSLPPNPPTSGSEHSLRRKGTT